ncbi:MAG: EamA family transporter [Chitinophagaceae bacterium]
MTTLSSNDKKPSQALVIAAFASLYIIWGSTYLAILIALKDIPPFLLAAMRFIAAGVILYAWCRIKGQPTPPLKSVLTISFSGILILFFGTGSLVWVEQYIPSGIAAIIIATTPLWFVVLDKRQWKFNFNNRYIIIGLLIGFAGVLTLFAGNNIFSVAGNKMILISFIVMLIGSFLWAAGSLYAKYTPAEGSTGMKASIQMMAAGFISLIPAFISGEQQHFSPAHVSQQAIMAILYLVSFGSLVGYISYIWLLSVRPPSLVGTYAYVNPVVAVFLGWLIAHEAIGRQQIIALVIILAGVIIVTLSKNKTIIPDSKNS